MDSLNSTVAVLKCKSYDNQLLTEKIRQILNLIGGLDQFIKPGMRVLLKPNMISAKAPERAITTHPELVAVVAREVRNLGATPVIGDSPGGAKRGIKRVWQNTGMLEISERDGIELINFEATGVVKMECNGRKYYLAKEAMEADFIINLPKLKTHVLTLMTGAVKNVFGLVPGFRKGNYHKEFPKPKDFAEIIVDILSLSAPGLTILDGILSMEGDGPSSGTPRYTNLLFASSDPVAIDAIIGEIIGFKPCQVPTTKIASEAGLGTGWPEAIRVVGEQLNEVKIDDFQLTSNKTFELIPKILSKFLGSLIWIRPAIDKKSCTKCHTCLNSCPTGALRLGMEKIPIFDYNLCINCWCCHELCPENSVHVNKSFLARKFIK
jgi:uncharacterized protein (DUF362 family)/Pyruvate/2-oxoacid:ferredoxin oxidoreductase delta subunit